MTKPTSALGFQKALLPPQPQCTSTTVGFLGVRHSPVLQEYCPMMEEEMVLDGAQLPPPELLPALEPPGEGWAACRNVMIREATR